MTSTSTRTQCAPGADQRAQRNMQKRRTRWSPVPSMRSTGRSTWHSPIRLYIVDDGKRIAIGGARLGADVTLQMTRQASPWLARQGRFILVLGGAPLCPAMMRGARVARSRGGAAAPLRAIARSTRRLRREPGTPRLFARGPYRRSRPCSSAPDAFSGVTETCTGALYLRLRDEGHDVRSRSASRRRMEPWPG